MAYREFYNDRFIKRLATYEAQSKTIPSVNTLPQNLDDRYNFLYVKGAVLLFNLEQKIGHENFVAFVKEVKHEDIKDDYAFFNLLEKMDGKENRIYLENIF